MSKLTWALHIVGPDDIYPAPSKDYAEVAAYIHNRTFSEISKKSGITCRAEVVIYEGDRMAPSKEEFIENHISSKG